MASTANMSGIPTSPGSSSLAIALKSPPPSPTKSKLLPTPRVADILAHDGSVDVRLLMISMWKHRANAPFTAELCQRLCSMPITQAMLDQVEFYLPQLAHMVVHLEQELPMEDMEQFVLLLSQSSVHFALQFFWMIYAALDENRPKRAGNNPRTLARCARLLLALEQCFVYGSPAARQASELLTRQSISRDEMEQILMADRRFFAVQQSSSDNGNGVEDVAPLTGGWLWKKGGGTRTMGRRNWTLRWCRLEKRILLVFSKPTDSQPRTAIPLHGAKVNVVENKRPFYFEITHDFSDTKAKFAAKTADELSTWVAYIQKTATLPEPPAGSPTKGNSSPERTLAQMSFAMRTFIMQSSTNVNSNATLAVDGTASPRSGSPSKTDSTVRSAEATVDALAANIEQMRTRMLSSGGVSGCSTQAGDTEVSQFSTTDCCGADALMQALMMPDQQRRYEFFCSMIHFIKSITDVSEALRRVEPPKRKELLRPLLKQLRLPNRAYIPLCKSTDPYCNVVSVFSDEGRVFSTHERAPCLIYFGTEENENGEDVSTVLFNELYETRTNCDGIVDEDDETVTTFDEHAADIVMPPRQVKPSPSSKATPLARRMSPFLRELLADDERKQRLEKTFGELTFTKAERLQETIHCANPDCWRLAGLMSKSYDDLRQEVLVMQLISYFQQIFELEKLPLRLHPYRILSTGSSTGLIEVVRNAMSLDGIKKTPGFKNLRSHFEQMYGGAVNNSEGDARGGDGAELLRQAKLNFIHSLAAYSIVCYILAIKDRHNGNIMLDIEGYIIHIDFGFFLGRAPGGSFSFETAPFKLTAEMVDVLGGRHSSNFQYFTDLCVQGALAARKHAETIYTLVEVMSYHSKLPCFVGGASGPLSGLKDRLFLNMPEKKVASTIQSMVQRAYDHFGTNKYDQFQVFSNGIAK
ncbi:phosphatidylinositol 3 and 4-kinase-like protein [Phytophthora cinnamomi]|uniref:phosphatidylinositol 3 and 4-kinase-like protein n=1 Tax=Phytophthora cinnamomi TaxID=4785 RepID=UPI0035595450|nr:phosphatidylinositol 3 and 4-kinase-like protein [Phytophthora cinnamomi]